MLLAGSIAYISVALVILFWRFPTLRGKGRRKYRSDRRFGNFVACFVVALFLLIGIVGLLRSFGVIGQKNTVFVPTGTGCLTA